MSMLVHVTRFNAVQQHVHRQVESYVHGLKQRMRRRTDCEAFLAEMSDLWERDFLATSHEIELQDNELGGQVGFSWPVIEELLVDVLEQIDVRMINGKAGDVLDYADSPSGLKVIAIGGDKLARGLTLEGLCTSYFLRASKMYDTLMQMGRWFGYRPGYLDLCRLYTTQDLVEWFEHIADAAEELRAEFDYMTDSRLTPREYGLKVKSHPVLLVTSPLKMRTATTLHLSFSGDLVETVSFYTSQEKLQANLDAFNSLCCRLGGSKAIPPQIRAGRKYNWNGLQWTNVGSHEVVEFLRSYQVHPDSRKVRSDLLANFVEQMSYSGELTSWTVVVLGGEGAPTPVGDGSVTLMTRADKAADNAEKYSIGRLLSPKDEMLDLDESGWNAALEITRQRWRKDPGRSTRKTPPDEPAGPTIRLVRVWGRTMWLRDRRRGS
ncbi:Z1 domain-containing protein [Halopseudomonas pachastrellae]|nr:Z1 domain-containing protein [Halopseudomonas pachastrellae]